MRLFLQIVIPVALYFGGFWIIDGHFYGKGSQQNAYLIVMLAAFATAWPRGLPLAISKDGLTIILKESRPWLKLPLSSLAGYRIRPGKRRLLDLFTKNGNTYSVPLHSDRNRVKLEAMMTTHGSLPVLEQAPETVRIIPWPEGPPVMINATKEQQIS